MIRITVWECRYLLGLVANAGVPSGIGYSADPDVARLQAKLSIALEVALRRERGKP